MNHSYRLRSNSSQTISLKSVHLPERSISNKVIGKKSKGTKRKHELSSFQAESSCSLTSDVTRDDTEGKAKRAKGRKKNSCNLTEINQTADVKATKKYEQKCKIINWGQIKTEGSKYIGAHVSIAGGLYNAIIEADKIGAKAIGMFLRSQRQWQSKPLDEETVEKFNATCLEYSFPKEMIVPHGSYLLNLGSPNNETRQKSVSLLIDELQRCDRLGIPLYNFHPGSTCQQISKEDCIANIASGINHSHEKSHSVITVIENMSGQGGTVGGQFEELRQIIDLVHDKSRIAVCLDTCHMFAAGYDISTIDGYEAMKSQFNKVVGFEYLKAFHLNDSKGKCGCHLDRHEDIGRGRIGLQTFRWIVNDPQFNNIPMVLETPGYESYDKAIKKLYSLVTE